jgi:hypothetical protein
VLKNFVVWASRREDPLGSLFDGARAKLEAHAGSDLKIIEAGGTRNLLLVAADEDHLRNLLDEFGPVVQIEEDKKLDPPV